MISYYTGISFITVLSMVVMIVVVRTNFLINQKVRNGFTNVAILIMLVAVFEWVGYTFTVPGRACKVIKLTVKCLEFSLAPYIPIACANTVSGEAISVREIILLIIHFILETMSAFIGFIYYVDENNIYYHGRLYIIYIMAYILGALFLFCKSIQLKKKYQGNNSGLILVILVFLFLGIPLQMIYEHIRVDWLVVAMALYMYYTFYNQLVLQIDPVTMLLNRTCYDKYIRNIKSDAVVTVFDINNFKGINDNYGHQYGDEILSIVGTAIKETYGKYGLGFRIGGDEFCAVIMKGYDRIDNITYAFEDYMNERRKADERVPKVALGYSLYKHDKNLIDDIIKAADDMMYINKKAGINKYNARIFV